MPVDPRRNTLLARLPPAEFDDLSKRLKLMTLDTGNVIYEARMPIEYSYFPVKGTLSAVAVLEGGAMIEVATIGKEGAAGLPSYVAAQTSPNRVFCQIPGSAFRIDAHYIEKKTREDGPLRRIMFAYQAAFIFQISQSVACNGLHGMLQRCCRWLLMSHDRVDGNEIPITHELIAIMLGVRRPGVTDALQTLKERGLIEMGRGKIIVLDRQGLEDSACECYAEVQAEYVRLLGN